MPTLAGAAPMAKKKPEPPKPAQGVIVTYKADIRTLDDVRAWLSELAEFVGLPVTVTMDQALREFARLKGFAKPMPRRQVK